MNENMVGWSLNWKKIGIPFFRANAILVKVSNFSSGLFLSKVMKNVSNLAVKSARKKNSIKLRKYGTPLEFFTNTLPPTNNFEGPLPLNFQLGSVQLLSGSDVLRKMQINIFLPWPAALKI